MRIVISLAFIGALSMSAAAAPMTALQRETAVWNDVKAKRMDAFAASMSPNFVGVYSEGTHDRARELGVVRTQILRGFAIRNFHTLMVDPADMLVTYSADVKGTYKGESFSGRYWNTSLWHQSGGRWLTVYHGEAKVR
jgi:hypothetical protein